MLSYIIATVLSLVTGFLIGLAVATDETTKYYENNANAEKKELEQKVDILKRQNEDLSDANEEWSEEYEKVSKELSAVKVCHNTMQFYPAMILGGIVVINAISIYVQTILRAKL